MQDLSLPVPAFFEMPAYKPISSRMIRKAKPPAHWRVDYSSDHHYQEMMAYFDTDTFESVGILEGDYTLICDCNLLVSRNGSVVRAASEAKDVLSSHAIDNLCRSNEFKEATNNIIQFWDQFPFIEFPAVLSDIYIPNYYHFSLEMAPRIRHFRAAALDRIVVGASALALPFQTSLLSRAGEGCSFIPAPQALRVRNPVLAYDAMSEDGVRWLHQVGPRATRGQRRIYIRRGSHSTRTVPGGGLHETAEILALLDALDFEIIEFGTGKTVSEQVQMLDGAGLVIATHGAALTNISYLEEGVSVLEILGTRTPRAMFMHVCAILGLNYSAMMTGSYTPGLDLIVDPNQLRECISKMDAFS